MSAANPPSRRSLATVGAGLAIIATTAALLEKDARRAAPPPCRPTPTATAAANAPQRPSPTPSPRPCRPA